MALIRIGLTTILLVDSFTGLARPVDTWPAPSLKETGLYADWDSKRVGPEKIRFFPRYPLWTDGAHKTRWMELPRGKFIDASNPDVEVSDRHALLEGIQIREGAEARFIERTPTRSRARSGDAAATSCRRCWPAVRNPVIAPVK